MGRHGPPVRCTQERPRSPPPRSQVREEATDHSRREQGGQKVRHVVGPPEYAATQKSRLGQQKRQVPQWTPQRPSPLRGAPGGWSQLVAVMLHHAAKSQFMQGVVCAVTTCVLGHGFESIQGHRGHFRSTWASPLELT